MRFAFELARRLEGSGVTANCLHPGFVRTEIGGRPAGALAKLGQRLSRLIQISPEKGARTSLFLACSPEVEGVTGKYFMDCRETPSSPASYDEEAQRKLWEISEELCGLKAGAV